MAEAHSNIPARQDVYATSGVLRPSPGTQSRSVMLRTVTVEDLARSSMFIRHPTSYGETLMHMIKFYTGQGLFGMGFAFRHTGMVMGIVLTMLFSLAAIYCNHTLINCAEKLRETFKLRKGIDMATVISLAMENLPHSCRCFSLCFSKTAVVSIIVLQLASCCVYIVFTGNAIKMMTEEFVEFRMDARIYMAIVTIPMFITTLIRELKYLAPLSLFANVVLSIGAVMVVIIISQDTASFSDRPYAISEFSLYPVFFGACLFSLAGIGMTLPLRNEMKNPDLFNCWYGVLNVAMIINALLLIIMGTLSYLKYGEEVKGSVILNLPTSEWQSLVIQVFITLSIITSYALQFYLANIMVWSEVNNFFPNLSHELADTIMNIILVGFTLICAVLLPRLGTFMALTGSLTVSLLLFIYPNVCDMVLRWPKDFGFLFWRFFFCIFLILFGIFCMVTGVYISIIKIMSGKD